MLDTGRTVTSMRTDRWGEAIVALGLLLAFVGDLRVAVPVAAVVLVAGAALGHLRPQAIVGAAVLAVATLLMETGNEVPAWSLALVVVTFAALGAATGARLLAGVPR